MKLLVVEDDMVSRLILQRTLERQGYQVLVAKDGQEGWEIFQREKEEVHLAILDWIMPNIDGMELCRRIKQAKTPHYVYVIFLSAKGEKKDIVRGLKAGADDYLTKPFDTQELLARVRVGVRIIRLEQALRQANQKLKILARTDELTRILNRRAIIEDLKREIARACREGSAICILMIDIDHFKKINDQYGHLVGDRVLVELVNRLKSHLRPYDLLGRYGGEEFLVVLPNTDAPIAPKIAERLRTSISQRPFEIEGERINVTISLGLVCVRPAKECNVDKLLEALLKKADAALYEAKEAGRNKVVSVPNFVFK